ncbi:MAG: porin family protein [Chitinophagaceae bacterium]
MKKTSLVALLIISFFLSTAQVQVGIFGGPQITSAKYTITGNKQTVTNKYGFHLGANLKVPFENKLYFSPAVFYSMKGYKVKFSQRSLPPDSLAIDNNTLIHTFELAALLQYDFSSQLNHFFVRFGPSLDIQLYGKEKFNRNGNTPVDQKMVFSFTKYGRFGANMILQFGYETNKGLLLSAQYSHGAGSINNADFGPRILHRVWGISIGKYLDRKNK